MDPVAVIFVMVVYNAAVNVDLFSFALTLSPATVDQLERTDITLTCSGDRTRLKDVKWLYNNIDGAYEAVVSLSSGACSRYNNMLTNNPNLYSYTCTDREFTLTVKNISRHNHGDKWQCRILSGYFVDSNLVTIQVKDPPDRPPNIDNLLNGSEVKSMQGEHVDFECSITGGNPLPILQWNINNESSMNIIGNTVTKAISRLANGTDPVELICQSFHPHRNESVNVKINILYPPGPPEIWLLKSPGTNVHLNKTLHVIEGRPFILNCSAKSNPPVSLYKWNELMPTNRSVLEFENYDRNSKSILCEVSNEMKTSDSRPAVTGTNVTHLAISVLFPPSVNKLIDRTVVEGDDVVYPCNFVPGNPIVTNVTWSWNGKTWNGRLLVIGNVSMHHAGIYRCDVRNLMVSSDGTTEYGYSNGEFYLSVQSDNNDNTSPTSSNVSVVSASAAGTVAGVVFLAALIIIITICKKRKRLSYQKREMSIQYHNCKDSKINETISTLADNANAQESFRHTGSDRQYDSLSPEDSKTEKKNDCQISAEGGNLHVYEGLQTKGFNQQYETISPSTCKVKIEHHKVYENLQV